MRFLILFAEVPLADDCPPPHHRRRNLDGTVFHASRFHSLLTILALQITSIFVLGALSFSTPERYPADKDDLLQRTRLGLSFWDQLPSSGEEQLSCRAQT